MNEEINTDEIYEFFLKDKKNNSWDKLTDERKKLIEDILNSDSELYIERDENNKIKYAWIYDTNKFWTYIKYHRTSSEYRNRFKTTKEIIKKIAEILDTNNSTNLQFWAVIKDTTLISMYEKLYKSYPKNKKQKIEWEKLVTYKIDKKWNEIKIKESKKWDRNNEIISYRILKESLNKFI